MNTGVHLARPLLDEKGVVLDSALKPEIADSWQRCLVAGLDPMVASEDCVLSFEKFYQRKQREERFLTLARPEMELLSGQIAGHNYLIAFGDSDGVVLDVLTDVDAEDSPLARSISPGSVWDERLRGTNALGLVVQRKRQIVVSGSEHFFAENGAISCIASPIFRSNGSLAGILDVTSPLSDRERHTASLVALSAQNISNRLFVEDHRHELIVRCHPREEYLATQSAGLLAFDEDGKMSGATAMARNILPDIAKLAAPCFSDVFQNGYNRVFDSICSGRTALLRDRRGSNVFVKIRPTHGRLAGLHAPKQRRTVALPAWKIHQPPSETPSFNLVAEDDFLKQQIQISAETAAARLPVRICGQSGSGLSETARAVHAQLPGMDHCIELDCSSVHESPLDLSLHGHMVDCDGLSRGPMSGSILETPGNVSLILDGIEGLGSRAVPIVKRLLAQLDRKARDQSDKSRWALIVTERSASKEACSHSSQPLALNDFWGHSFCLPSLSERTDVKDIAQGILAEFSTDARIEDEAIHLICQAGDSLTFYALRRLIFQLYRRNPNGALTESRVLELLPQFSNDTSTCPACEGHSSRETNCRRIRKTVRECDGNVSLAARHLGMSRNTIYKHMGQLK
jgi:transcriptional regulator of acetoin/glycerol metabolism